MSGFIPVRVTDIRQVTPVIREVSLQSLGSALPAFSAGSHIQVLLPNGKRNAYSLLSDPLDTRHYRIAVRRQDDSRGGSRYVHEQLQVGDELRIAPPANLFPLHNEAHLHILLAAGIGITPFIPYCAELLRRGAPFELHYAYRCGVSDAYVAQLRELIGERLHCYDSPQQRLDLKYVFSNRPLGSHIYACGPQRLLDDLHQQAATLGWSDSRIHSEAFTAAQSGEPFSVQLLRSQQQLSVGADQSLLEALEAAGVEVPNLCRGGVCGQCQTAYLQGDVEHRDHFLSPEEQTASLMPCVSRGCGQPILLDL